MQGGDTMKSLKEQTLGNRVELAFNGSDTVAIFEAGGHQRHELGDGFVVVNAQLRLADEDEVWALLVICETDAGELWDYGVFFPGGDVTFMSDDAGQNSRLHELVGKAPEDFWPFEYRYDGLVNTPFDPHVSKYGWSSYSTDDYEEHVAHKYANAVGNRNLLKSMVVLRAEDETIKPLTEQQAEVAEWIRDQGRPVSGKEIVNALGLSSESTLTSRFIPALKDHGLKNRRGAGYYFPSTD